MVLGVIRRSFGRIFVNLTRDEAYALAKEIVSDLKFNIKDENPTDYYFEGKTKLTWTKNKFAEKFFILVKNGNNQSVIDIYFNGYGMTGPDTKVLITPFYKKLIEKTGTTPELRTCLMDIKEEDIIKSANEIVYLDTQSSASIESIPNDNTTNQESSIINETQTLVRSTQTDLMSSSSNDIMTIEQMLHEIGLKHDQFKAQWNKNGVIQFKNQHIAILQRSFGSQVQFIIAYDQLTREGYRLMAIDEGKSGGQSSGGFTGGVNSYYYFQKMEYVR